MAQYLVLVEDLETQSYFLHLQEIKAIPENLHQPIVDLHVSRHLAQLATISSKLKRRVDRKEQLTSR